MNERIRLLAEQAGMIIVDDKFSTYGEFAEKFAELIVRECGQWFNDRLVVEPDYNLPHRIERNRAVVGVMKEYNTHFGVEE
jgi:hypothetical protein